MRHGKKNNSLSRTSAHRRSMFANMASSLIEHKRINTTTAKAKALRGFIEPLITKSKTDTTHNRRLVFAKLRNKQAVSELFREIAPKVGDRPGGYVRIIKLGNRLGDNAEMALIELVDYNETYDLKSGDTKKSTRRSRRGGKKKTAATQEAQPAQEKKAEEAPKKEAPKKEAKETKEAKEAKKEPADTADTKEAPKAKKAAPKKEKENTNDSETKTNDKE